MINHQLLDIKEFVNHFSPNDLLTNSTFLITGATGLIGSTIIHCLIALNRNIHIIAPLRSLNKAIDIFTNKELKNIDLIECDLLTYDYRQCRNVDYIIHCAAPTGSCYFVEKPVETFRIITEVTKNLLDYAVKNTVESFVFLSSLEVYGVINNDDVVITEDIQGFLDPLSVRSSYPMAKRAAENLCILYAHEYGVPTKVARLTQTTGIGISKDDNRVIAQFARLAANGQDIILHTTGESARPYCYTTDAVSGILYILLKGKVGEAYNVSNDETYISAKGMAEYLRDNYNPQISVRIEINNDMGYAPATKLRLSSTKLMGLGWTPQYGLKEIFDRLIPYLEKIRK